ncbi:MAG TPA: penicillin-binding protein 1C [Candidatus Gracilibacteria bacterium]|nr:penicillin-binding protein 1C [Candidatus Gracilibacteria bacterium]
MHNRIFKWVIALIGGMLLLMMLIYIYIAYFLPLPDALKGLADLPTTKIFDRNGVLLYEVLRPDLGKVTPIKFNQIPKDFINATLAAEDINYYSHPGIDIWAIGRAIFFNVREQRVVSGASTITQQLVRNMMGTPHNARGEPRERNLWDKVQEAMYAVRLNNLYNKDQILELYLNRIYYGNMAYGSQSAALDYFGQNLYDLDLAQLAFLAGLPQSPSYYNPFVNFDNAKKRQAYVLEQMAKYSFITTDQVKSAKAEPLRLRPNKYKMKAPHFVHYVMNQIEETYGEESLLSEGLIITTTLDYNLEMQAEQIIKRQIDRLHKNNVNNGALLALDVKTGQILTWVGSADYFDQDIDGAVDMVTALRQPGSSIKPLTYLLAFEKGYTPATVIYDIPTQFNTESGTYAPKNYDLDYHGPVRARVALASSYNIPAVKTLEYIGVPRFISFLKTVGINTLTAQPDFYGLALTLGGGEVKVIDMANAFNTIANYGYFKQNSAILEIKNSKNETLFKWAPPEQHFVLGKNGQAHAYQIIDILKDPLARLPGFGEGSVLEISHEAAVKTGTTRNFRDNWTIGFTPQILTAVWVGNADASPMQNVSGVDGAAPIWADFMESALQFKPKLSFPVPKGMVNMEICAISGLLPTENCQERVYEWFAADERPKESDNYYQKVWIDKKNGMIIPDTCISEQNAASFEQKTIIAYPAELQQWATSKGLQMPQISPCALSSAYPSAYTKDTSATSKPTTAAPKWQSSGYTNDYPVEEHPPSIVIQNPINNDEYLVDSLLPLESQKIPIRVVVPLQAVKVEYFIDDKKIGERSSAPYTLLWLPQKGKHVLKVTALLSTGALPESAKVQFEVK